jgi:hypothetical protein
MLKEHTLKSTSGGPDEEPTGAMLIVRTATTTFTNSAFATQPALDPASNNTTFALLFRLRSLRRRVAQGQLKDPDLIQQGIGHLSERHVLRHSPRRSVGRRHNRFWACTVSGTDTL